MPTHKRTNKCRRFERFHANRTQAQAEGFRSIFRYAIDEMGARHEYLASKTGPDPVANWTELAIEVEKLLLDCNLPLGRVKKDLVPSPKQWQMSWCLPRDTSPAVSTNGL
jgi:hypothetical protein